MNNTTKILVAFGAGAATGAILGILFAPDKGSELRRKINEQGKKVADDVKGKFQKGKEKFNDLKDDLGQAISEKVEDFV